MKKLIVVGTVAMVGIVGAFALMRSGGPKGAEVFVHNVVAGDIRAEVSGSGEIQAKTRVNISSTIPGEIVGLPVEEGDLVKRGDVLVRIDPQRYIQEVESLEAQLRMARIGVEQERTRFANLDSSYRRQVSLRDQGLVSQEAFDQAKLNFDSSRIQLRSLEAQVEQVTAALGKVQDDLKKTTIYAPMDGKVTALNTEVGEQVIVGTTNVPGSVMLVVSDMSELLAEIDVDESQIAKVHIGQPVRINVDAVESIDYRGKVTEIRNSARKKGEANVFGVKVLLQNGDARLRPGMTAKARIAIESKSGALRVPIQAVVERPVSTLGNPAKAVPGDEKVDAIVLMRDSKAKAVRVQTGLSDDDYVEIVAGIREGDAVVTGPYRTLRRLKDDELVRAKDPTLEMSDDDPNVVVD